MNLQRVTSRVLIVLAAITMGCFQAPPSPPSITVIGTAEVEIPPDHLLAWVSVATVDTDPMAAHRENDRKVREILAFLTSLGVPPKDVSTDYTNLAEKYKRGPDGEQVYQGYEAETSIRAVIRDLALYDRLIDGSLSLGLNRIWGIEFRSSAFAEKNRYARTLAIRAAREKAEYLASEIGQRVGPPVSVTELAAQERRPWDRTTSYASNTYVVEDSDTDFSSDVTQNTIAPQGITVRQQVEVVFRLTDDA